MDKVDLPNNIFFTGVPGSKWSGIAQLIEGIPGFNCTDRSPAREYTHNHFGGHKGAYFGECMEFDAKFYDTRKAYSDPEAGCKVLKSHDWAYDLNIIYEHKVLAEEDWIMLVYRPEMVSYAWWFQAGGFNITYPCYDAYENPQLMFTEIQEQNKKILEFGSKHKCTWSYFTPEWIEEHFGVSMDFPEYADDVLVALVKL